MSPKPQFSDGYERVIDFQFVELFSYCEEVGENFQALYMSDPKLGAWVFIVLSVMFLCWVMGPTAPQTAILGAETSLEMVNHYFCKFIFSTILLLSPSETLMTRMEVFSYSPTGLSGSVHFFSLFCLSLIQVG